MIFVKYRLVETGEMELYSICREPYQDIYTSRNLIKYIFQLIFSELICTEKLFVRGNDEIELKFSIIVF